MNHRLIEKNSMYKKMLVFFANPLYIAIWNGFQRLTDEIAKFLSLNGLLDNYIQIHQIDTKGLTSSKNNAFSAMVKLVMKSAQKAYVWAVDTADDNLVQIFDVEKSDFYQMTETMAYTKIKNIRDALNDNIASMASVQLTAGNVTALDAAIKAYEDMVGIPGAAQSHKTEATGALEELMLPMDTSLELIDKLIDSSYADSHSDMVKEYFINRNIDKLPTHHSGVVAVITDAITGGVLQGALLAVGSKTATSNIEGIAEIIKIKPGTYMAKISLAQYITQDIKVVIGRGKITKIEVKLAK